MKFLRQILLLSFIATSALNLDASTEKKQKSKLTQEQIEAKKEAGKAVREERAAKRVAQTASEERSEQDKQDSNSDEESEYPQIHIDSSREIDYSTMSIDRLSEEMSDLDKKIKELEDDIEQVRDHANKEETKKELEKLDPLECLRKEERLIQIKQEYTRCCRYYNEKYDAENKESGSANTDYDDDIATIKRRADAHLFIVTSVCHLFGLTSKSTEYEFTLLLPKKYFDTYTELCENLLLQKLAQRKHWFYATLTAEEKATIFGDVRKLQAADEKREAQEKQAQELNSTENTLQQ